MNACAYGNPDLTLEKEKSISTSMGISASRAGSGNQCISGRETSAWVCSVPTKVNRFLRQPSQKKSNLESVASLPFILYRTLVNLPKVGGKPETATGFGACKGTDLESDQHFQMIFNQQ